MQYRNAQHNDTGGIDCEIEHPVYGWIPFTADPNDPEKHGRDIFVELQDVAAPYVAPTIDATGSLEAERQAAIEEAVAQAEADRIAALRATVSERFKGAKTVEQVYALKGRR